MATKRGGGRGEPPPPGGSPIIVDGGGSVDIDFDHNAYHQNGNKHKSKNPALQIAEIVLTGSINQTIPVNGQQVTVTVNLQ